MFNCVFGWCQHLERLIYRGDSVEFLIAIIIIIIIIIIIRLKCYYDS